VRSGRRPGPVAGARGQATVELALVLPVVVLALLLVVQVALVGLSQILVVQAARAAGRAAAVEAELAPVRAAARQTPGLRSDRLSVERGPRGEPGSLVSVTVRYLAPTDLPLVGRMLGDVTLTATAVHRVEGDDAPSAALPQRRPP
jgi:hypothetical protein